MPLPPYIFSPSSALSLCMCVRSWVLLLPMEVRGLLSALWSRDHTQVVSLCEIHLYPLSSLLEPVKQTQIGSLKRSGLEYGKGDLQPLSGSTDCTSAFQKLPQKPQTASKVFGKTSPMDCCSDPLTSHTALSSMYLFVSLLSRRVIKRRTQVGEEAEAGLNPKAL